MVLPLIVAAVYDRRKSFLRLISFHFIQATVIDRRYSQKQKPHRRFGSGVWKALVNESKPDRRAAQQQRLKQQVQIQFAIHTVLIGHFAVGVNPLFAGFPP
jgi:hypothetical protein